LKDTAEAFDLYDKPNDIYELRTKLLKQQKKNLKISQLMYENGIVNYIDVLDAQRNDAIAFSVRTDKKNRKKVIR